MQLLNKILSCAVYKKKSTRTNAVQLIQIWCNHLFHKRFSDSSIIVSICICFVYLPSWALQRENTQWHFYLHIVFLSLLYCYVDCFSVINFSCFQISPLRGKMSECKNKMCINILNETKETIQYKMLKFRYKLDKRFQISIAFPVCLFIWFTWILVVPQWMSMSTCSVE